MRLVPVGQATARAARAAAAPSAAAGYRATASWRAPSSSSPARRAGGRPTARFLSRSARSSSARRPGAPSRSRGSACARTSASCGRGATCGRRRPAFLERFCFFRRSGFRGEFFWALMEGVSLAGVVGMGLGSRSPGISRPVSLVAGSGSARGISIAPAVDDLAAFLRLFMQGGRSTG